jgi:hypothetical protein
MPHDVSQASMGLVSEADCRIADITVIRKRMKVAMLKLHQCALVLAFPPRLVQFAVERIGKERTSMQRHGCPTCKLQNEKSDQHTSSVRTMHAWL